MSGVFNQMYVHLVWQTKYRRRILEGDLDAFVARRVAEIACDQRLTLLGFGSAWDHVHVLLKWNTVCGVGDVVQRLKSFTSMEWNKLLEVGEVCGPSLAWQSGYGALAVRHGELPKIIAYVENQKRHHHNNRLSADFEMTGPSKS